LHKIIKDNRLDPSDNLRLHCFPEISCDGSTQPPGSMTGAAQFQPVDFKQGGLRGDSTAGGQPRPWLRADDAGSRSREIEEKAYTEGYEAGERRALEHSQRKMEPVLRNFQQALEAIEQMKRKIRLTAERETVDLALAIARKIVGQEISVQPQVIENILQKALEKVEGQDSISIILHPDDLAHMQSADNRICDLLAGYDHLQFKADGSMQKGGCLIETEMGCVDARIEKQIEAVEDLFKRELQKANVI